MSEPIKAGDLVMVVRPTPCCQTATGAEGQIFRVTRMDGYFRCCKFCSADFGVGEDSAYGFNGGRAVRLSRLKRIPPLSELDDVKQDEEITV